MCVCVCVCVWEREREREMGGEEKREEEEEERKSQREQTIKMVITRVGEKEHVQMLFLVCLPYTSSLRAR